MALPDRVSILEVGPRDGFQSIKTWIETPVKIRIIRALLDAGVDKMEAVSFISPKAIPQMRDAAEIIAALRGTVDMDRLYALVGNLRGAHQAADAGMKNLTFVISASESHNLSNVNRTPEQSVAALRELRAELPQMHVKLSIATAFGCPFEGEVGMDKLCYLIDSGLELGIRDFGLCDTIGVATPLQTGEILDELDGRYSLHGEINWSLHLHNTRGLASANAYVGLERGITQFETAAAGLGGCPFAPGASGNMATEDMVYLLQDMGIKTAVQLDRLIDVAGMLTQAIQVRRESKIDAVTVHKVFPR